MSSNKRWQLLVLFGLMATFAMLAYSLMQFRIKSGDIFPPYSSMRADPIGTKGLLESFQQLEGMEARRHLARWDRLKESPATVFILGLPANELAASNIEDAEPLEELVQLGSRIVIGFSGRKERVDRDSAEFPDKNGNRRVAKSETPETEEDSDVGLQSSEQDSEEGTSPEAGTFFEALLGVKRWGYDIGFSAKVARELALGNPAEAELVADRDLPQTLNLYSATYFQLLDSDWEVIYKLDGNPVVIEKTLEHGSIVLLADCFELSNQALYEAPKAHYLSWLVGPHSRILFEETHLGVSAKTNLMGLIKRFRLHGVLLGLVLWALCFIWQQSSSLIPPQEEDRHNGPIGQHAGSGLIHLLIRGLPKKSLLETCVTQWQSTLKVHQRHLQSHEKVVLAALEHSEKQTNLVTQYNELQTLATRRHP